MTKPLHKIIKTYPCRGPLNQFRFEKSISFVCFRCSNTKTSKLVSTYRENWNLKLCNGCYGRLISLYEIRSSSDPSEAKFSALDQNIRDIWSQFENQVSELEREISKKSSFDSDTNKFLATAEFLKRKLPDEENLEWSPAIISLCKAVENELVKKWILPLKLMAEGAKVNNQVIDKRTQRLEKYIMGINDTPPELGSIYFFIDILSKSESFRNNSPTFELIKEYSQKRPLSYKFYSSNGISDSLKELVENYRNKAAHIEVLKKEDYICCEEITLSEGGILNEILKSVALR